MSWDEITFLLPNKLYQRHFNPLDLMTFIRKQNQITHFFRIYLNYFHPISKICTNVISEFRLIFSWLSKDFSFIFSLFSHFLSTTFDDCK